MLCNKHNFYGKLLKNGPFVTGIQKSFNKNYHNFLKTFYNLSIIIKIAGFSYLEEYIIYHIHLHKILIAFHKIAKETST
jgi:hypothetical protein